MTIILGIDPGLYQTGIAIIEQTDDNILLKDSGYIQTNPKLDRTTRLSYIQNKLAEEIDKHDPDVVAIEIPFIQKYRKSVFALLEVRGVILAECGHHLLKVYDYAPSTIKKTLIGKGNATKDDMMKYISIYFERTFHTQDEVDAIATALCHIEMILQRETYLRHIPVRCRVIE